MTRAEFIQRMASRLTVWVEDTDEEWRTKVQDELRKMEVVADEVDKRAGFSEITVSTAERIVSEFASKSETDVEYLEAMTERAIKAETEVERLKKIIPKSYHDPVQMRNVSPDEHQCDKCGITKMGRKPERPTCNGLLQY